MTPEEIIEQLRAKLAAAEAERDHWAQCCNEWADTATKHACRIMDLEVLLAATLEDK